MSEVDPAIVATVDALLEGLALKAEPRRGWLRVGVEHPESVAAHTWGISWLLLVLSPPGIDLGRALAYAAVHDLPEAWVGDITPHDGISVDDKHARERAAMEALEARISGGSALAAWWAAYEAQADPEAQLVRELDRLDMALQAVVYAKRGDHDVTAFLDAASRVIRRPELRAVLDELQRRV